MVRKKKKKRKLPLALATAVVLQVKSAKLQVIAVPKQRTESVVYKVLGAGCKSCHEQYENAREAVKAMGLSVEVEYITDMQKVMEYGVMSMPALVVNEKVVSMGKVLKTADVEKLLHKLGF